MKWEEQATGNEVLVRSRGSVRADCEQEAGSMNLQNLRRIQRIWE
jgi:hypothetical protein